MAILDSYSDAVAELGAVEQMWNPFQLVYTGDHALNQWASFIHSMQNIGLYLLVLMAALKFVKLMLDELNGIPALTALLGVGVELTLTAVFLLNYTWFAEIFPSLFHKLTHVVLNSYDGDMMKQVVEALRAVGGEKSSDTKWFSSIFSLSSIPNLISTAMAGLALALYWVMSKWAAVLYTFWYLIGPLLVPFYLFPPFRGIAERWFSSLLGASFMGVVGSIMFLLMVKMQWLSKAFSSGVNSSYTAAMVFSILILLLMISIPKLSNSIWQGISSSVAQAVAAATMAGEMATSTALAGAGAALQMGGGAVRQGAGMAGILNRYSENAEMGLGAGARIRDAVVNRGSFLRKGTGGTTGERMLRGVHQSAQTVRDIGKDFLVSQLPGPLQTLSKSLDQGSKVREKQAETRRDQAAVREHLERELGPERAGQISFPDGWRLRQEVGQSPADAAKKAANQIVRQQRSAETAARVRAEAERLVGPEKAQALVMPDFFKVKVRPGQSEAAAFAGAAEGLLRKQNLIDDSQQVKMDHAALKAFMVKKLGPERAKDVLVPSDWRVMAKRGQSKQEAIAGSATALMQELGLIDRKDRNEIAKRYTYAQSRKKPSSPNPKGNESV